MVHDCGDNAVFYSTENPMKICLYSENSSKETVMTWTHDGSPGQLFRALISNIVVRKGILAGGEMGDLAEVACN
jgi:hypothetical protein